MSDIDIPLDNTDLPADGGGGGDEFPAGEDAPNQGGTTATPSPISNNPAFGGTGSRNTLGGTQAATERGSTLQITRITVNNIQYSSGDAAIEIPLVSPVINWAYSTINPSVRQVFYEVRIGMHKYGLGTSNYMPDVYRQPFTKSPASFWRLKEKYISRGGTYYGQIRLRDNTGRNTAWKVFVFKINRQPRITSAKIQPEKPGLDSDLELQYNVTETDTVAKIRWFRNGVYQSHFDNYQRISHTYMRYKDIWLAEITPHDNLEYGPTVTTDSVEVVKSPPVVSGLEVLPKFATDQDILEASYYFEDQGSGNNKASFDDKSKIRWYVNNFLIENANDSRFVRLALKPGDEVFFTVTPSDGLFDGETLASDVRTISDVGFRVANLRIDGESDNINVSTVNPTIEWNVIEPFRRFARYANIEIGTAPGADNVYSTTLNTYDEKFTVPDNILEKGIDYFISVSVSDSADDFQNKTTSRFRVSGNRWEKVNNSTGWTVEISIQVNEEGYHYLSIADGNKFAQVRFSASSVTLMGDDGIIESVALDMRSYKNIIVCGQNSDIKIYNNNSLIIDGSSKLLVESSSRFLEIGSSGNSSSVAFVKYVVYTVKGAYFPDVSDEYSKIHFEPFIDFVGSSVDAITEHEGSMLVAANPRNEENSGILYKVVEVKKPVLASTENLDNVDVRLHSLSASPDEKFVFFGHTKGASVFENYIISKYDVMSDFSSGTKPDRDLWEKVQTTPFLAESFSSDGLIIDTTFSNTSIVDDRTLLTPQSNISAITITSKYENTVLYDYWVEVDNNNLKIWGANKGSAFGLASLALSVALEGKTIQEVCDIINETESFNLKYFLLAESLNDTANQYSNHLNGITPTEIFPSITLLGTFRQPDLDNPNPYSYASGGKWFYTHRKHGTPWFEKVDNEKGWTVDFDVTLDRVEDSDRPSDVDNPEGLGLYLNDGKFYENICILPQEIILSESKSSVLYDTTTFTKLRITGKGKEIKVFAKKSDDLYYKLIVESEFASRSTNQANGGRPSIAQSSNGFLHAVWHDDGNGGKRQIYYSYFDPNLALWSQPELIVKDSFGASNPDIAISGFGHIYVVFESLKTDYTDIGVIVKNDGGWSEPYLITSNKNASLNPKIAIDDANNVHVVWEDYRLDEPEIYYCRRNAADGQWISSAFGFLDTVISNAPAGAKRPAIAVSGLNVYVSWTFFRANGTSGINVSYYNAGSKIWFSSGQKQFDFLVSSNDSRHADYSDIIIDKKGRVFTLYHDVINNNYQIFVRRANPFLTVSNDITQLTQGSYDARYPKCGLNDETGDIYVVFEKEQDQFVDPYLLPYLEEQDVSLRTSGIYLIRFNALQQVWESSNQRTRRLGVTYGTFDVNINPSDARTSHRPNIASKYVGDLHILYESEMVVSTGNVNPNKDMFVLIKDAVFDHTFESVYSLADDAQGEYAALDPYLERDQDLSGQQFRKEIRFGDFSNSVGIKFKVAQIRYYLSHAVEPFNIKLLSSATLNMPSSNVYSIKGNNRGDAYLGTDEGLLFFDKSSNNVFIYDDAATGIADKKIYDIVSDTRGNLYIASNDGVWVSHDHSYFWKLSNSQIPNNTKNIEIDYLNQLYIGTDEGVIILDTNDFVNNLRTTSENYQSTRFIDVAVVKIDTSNGLPSNFVNVVKVDANGVAWIGTNKGLVRYRNGKTFVFTQRHGLASNKVLDISIRNTAIRYIASTAGVDKMTGINIERLDFDNINAPIASLIERSTTEVEIPNFNNAKAILWKDPNLLYICSLNDIYQITFVDEQFYTEQTQISKFEPQSYALVEVKTVRNDDLQTFRLVGVEDLNIPETAVFEIYLNGKPITRGFKFSPKYQLLRFDYPLNKHDIISVNVRLDIEKIADFSQNKAQRIAIGNQATRIKEIVSSAGNIYVRTDGDINTVQVNDFNNDLPYDRIILDTTPPKGKIIIGDQLDRTKVRVNIDKLDPYTPFDNASGIDKLIVSNFTNFTTDGQQDQEPLPFVTSLTHDLGVVFDNVVKQFTFPDGSGKCIGRWDRSDNNPIMFAGASAPARIYGFDPVNVEWTLRTTLTDSDQVNFITSFNNILIIGTGSDAGIGKIYKSSDGINFTLVANLPVSHAYCAEILDNKLYIGGGGDSGVLISFDGDNVVEVFSNISGSIYDLTSADGVLYAATGEEGRVYRLDPVRLTQQIVHVDNSSKIISISAATVNSVDFVFAGTGSGGKIIRQRLPDAAFTHSFRTVSNPVYSIETINGTVYAAIGKTLFSLNNVWQSRVNHSEDILDIQNGPGDIVWFCSANYVYRIEAVGLTRNVYLKLIDRAGNETKLFTDEAQTQLDSNLYDSVTITDLAGFVNKNRILEVDEFGDTVSSYNGNDYFYSADKVDEEIGVYFSEVFNGSNSLVRWDKISWDAIVPDNTDFKVYIRTASNRDDVLESDFNTVLNYNESGADLSFLSGQYLQFKVVMSSKVRDLSPSLRLVVIRSIASESTHFFTTNFVLPSRVKSGILTSQKMIPIAADIIFGINTSNSVDFGDYQIIDENRLFTTDEQQIGEGLRVGVRLITPSTGEFIAEDFGEYGPYDTLLEFNSIEWSVANSTSDTQIYDFRVSFYEDASEKVLVYQAVSKVSTGGFSAAGEMFDTSGLPIPPDSVVSLSYTPVGDNPIRCNTYYFIKVEANNGSGWTTVLDSKSFIEACGTTFVDYISFDYQNVEDTASFHFRIRFYDDAERTNLVLTAYSGNDILAWQVDDSSIDVDGAIIPKGMTRNISYTPDSSSFVRGTTYYLSIDAFDGVKFTTHSNSFTFRIQNVDSEIYCGPYTNVPVLKNMALMFELENGQFVTLRLEE